VLLPYALVLAQFRTPLLSPLVTVARTWWYCPRSSCGSSRAPSVTCGVHNDRRLCSPVLLPYALVLAQFRTPLLSPLVAVARTRWYCPRSSCGWSRAPSDTC
jgi:hypothetical protein